MRAPVFNDQLSALSRYTQHFLRCIVPRNAADCAAALRARATEKDILKLRLDAPFAYLRFFLRKWKRRRVLENVAVVHPERVLDINRAFTFDAEIPVARHGETLFQRLLQPLVHALEEFVFREFSHRLIIPRKQTPRRIETEQRHRMESLFSQFRRENAVIS